MSHHHLSTFATTVTSFIFLSISPTYDKPIITGSYPCTYPPTRKMEMCYRCYSSSKATMSYGSQKHTYSHRQREDTPTKPPLLSRRTSKHNWSSKTKDTITITTGTSPEPTAANLRQNTRRHRTRHMEAQGMHHHLHKITQGMARMMPVIQGLQHSKALLMKELHFGTLPMHLLQSTLQKGNQRMLWITPQSR